MKTQRIIHYNILLKNTEKRLRQSNKIISDLLALNVILLRLNGKLSISVILKMMCWEKSLNIHFPVHGNIKISRDVVHKLRFAEVLVFDPLPLSWDLMKLAEVLNLSHQFIIHAPIPPSYMVTNRIPGPNQAFRSLSTNTRDSLHSFSTEFQILFLAITAKLSELNGKCTSFDVNWWARV